MISTKEKIEAAEHAVKACEERLAQAVEQLAAEHRRLQRERGVLDRLRKRLQLERLGGKKLADAELGFDDVVDSKTDGEPRDHSAQAAWYRELTPARRDAVAIANEENYSVHVGCGGEVWNDSSIGMPVCARCNSRVLSIDIQHPTVTVHLLRHGLAACGFSREVPALWPKGHRWCRNITGVTCAGCRHEVERTTC